MMTPAKDVETSVTTNDSGSSQEYTLLETDQQTTQSNVTPRFKPYTVFNIVKKVAVSHHGDSTFSLSHDVSAVDIRSDHIVRQTFIFR